MGKFFQRLLLRAATTDELLSQAFVSLPGEKSDTDGAALRLSAWCRFSASGNWGLFSRRLARDGLALTDVLERFSTVCGNSTVPPPLWHSDAEWVLQGLGRIAAACGVRRFSAAEKPQPFEELLFGLVEDAEKILRNGLDPTASSLLSESAYCMLCRSLLSQLADLSASALYEVYSEGLPRNHAAKESRATFTGYSSFLDYMRERGFEKLFEARPVLLRLIASMTRQWIDSTREFILRLSSDFREIRSLLCAADHYSPVTSIVDQVSDHHNFGRSVLLITFADGHRVVYKPKDLRVDSAWFDVISWLNANGGPVDLRTPRVVVGNGYGWAEHIDCVECTEEAEFATFFRRAGCWVALFHVFAGTDIHKENVIAVADHPVPIDLEMLLQAEEAEKGKQIPSLAALKLATRQISNSVAFTGLLPSFGRNLRNGLVDLGGLSQPSTDSIEIYWDKINQDGMRVARRPKSPTKHLNMPSIAGRTALLTDFIEPFIAGFNAYATFLCHNKERILSQNFWTTLAGSLVRKILRPTRYYYLLLTRLKAPRNMGDGAEWSSHADFCSRLIDWDCEEDPIWPLLRSERNALIDLNIPHFVMHGDGITVTDGHGISAQLCTETGLERARTRLQRLNAMEIGRQSDIIRTVTTQCRIDEDREASPVHGSPQYAESMSVAAAESLFMKHAEEIVMHISHLAIRSGLSAAWIGLDWHGDSEKSRLIPLGCDLYSGSLGISLILAAHARVTGDKKTAELALAGLAALRFNVRSLSAARFSRIMGRGGALGMGSVVYGLTVIGSILKEEELIDDAIAAATHFTDEFIAADRTFDTIGGSAGAILCLLKLYRQTGNKTVLARAVKCGEHLLQTRPRQETRQLWSGTGVSAQSVTGMSHGAAGFAYAFGALYDATKSDAFLRVAKECVQFENSFFDITSGNWPDHRQPTVNSENTWPCQWCHGAGGIGLARIGLLRHTEADANILIADISAAVKCAEMRWPDNLDTLCCGSLGNIELLQEAGPVLKRPELKVEAVRRLVNIVHVATMTGDFRLGSQGRRFNLGLYKGIAGVGYTLLRQIVAELPNVLLWE